MPANFPDIFSPTGQFFNGAFRADSASVTFAGFAGAGLLMQQIQFSYSQQVTRLWEIGSTYVYYVIGRAQGQMSISRIIGPTALSLAMIQQLANGCNAGSNMLNIRASVGCGQGSVSGSSALYTISGVVITAISVAVAAQDMVINEQLQMTFAAMNMTAGGPTTASGAASSLGLGAAAGAIGVGL